MTEPMAPAACEAGCGRRAAAGWPHCGARTCRLALVRAKLPASQALIDTHRQLWEAARRFGTAVRVTGNDRHSTSYRITRAELDDGAFAFEDAFRRAEQEGLTFALTVLVHPKPSDRPPEELAGIDLLVLGWLVHADADDGPINAAIYAEPIVRLLQRGYARLLGELSSAQLEATEKGRLAYERARAHLVTAGGTGSEPPEARAPEGEPT